MTVTPEDDNTYTYQWYSNTENSTTGGTEIEGATNASYDIPAGKTAGNTEYYYCVVTASCEWDNTTAEAASGAAMVTVAQKEVGLTWSDTNLTYNGEAQAPAATATGLVDGDECTVTVTGAQTNVGTDYTATASALSSASTCAGRGSSWRRTNLQTRSSSAK